MIKDMKKKAKELHDQSTALYKQAEEMEQAELLPKFQHLKGTCFKICDGYNDKKWNIYYLVKEVRSVYKTGRKLSATLGCFSFNDAEDEATFFFSDAQFHDTLRALKAKTISRQEFDDALESQYAKIQLASEI